MHAQQLPGGGAVGPPTMPIAMPHPGLAGAGGPSASQLAALTNSSNSTSGPGGASAQAQQQQHQLALLSKQELMLQQHQQNRPEEAKSVGGMSANEDSRHVSVQNSPVLEPLYKLSHLFREIQYHQATSIVRGLPSQPPT